MKVKCIKDFREWKKGQVYELHTAEPNQFHVTHYLDCDKKTGYERGKWGFVGLDDWTFKANFEFIEDDTKHDEHYKACGIEPWVIMEANFKHDEFIGFLKGNILKYCNRLGRKGQDLDDCDKIANYAQKLKEVLQKDIVQK